jgi:hypothetical protein
VQFGCLEGKALAFYSPTKKKLRNLLDLVQPRPVLFLHLFEGANSSPEISQLGKFLLDRL